MGDWPILIFLGILAVVSGLFSGTETVLFSLARADRVRMKKSGKPLEAMAAGLLDRPRALLTTLLLGNMTCNALIFVLSAFLLGHVHGLGAGAEANWSGGAIVALLSLLPPLLVTYVSDVFPKVVGSLNNTRIAPLVALPVATLVRALYPLTRALDWTVLRPVHRLVGVRRKNVSFNVDELRELLEMSQEQGVIDVSENDLLQEIVRIGELRVRDVMTPRVDMVAFDIRAGNAEALIELFRKTRLAKLPVCEGQVDNILGLIYAKALLLEADDPKKADLRKLIQPVRFVPEMQTLERLLQHFRKTKTQIAVVVDEYGAVLGIVSLEDVVEQMVGDLFLPHDAPVSGVQRVGTDEYVVPGDLSVADWVDAFGEPETPDRAAVTRVSTVAGMLASCLKRLPKTGDVVQFGHLMMTVEAMRGRRVDRVRLKLVDGQVELGEAAR